MARESSEGLGHRDVEVLRHRDVKILEWFAFVSPAPLCRESVRI